MKALRQLVERAVRPIRASNRTKDRMRAELLEHLTSLYEEELRRSPDAAVALDAAAQRLGEPKSLSHELQSSVSLLERWAMIPIPGSHWSKRRGGESIYAWILRTTTAATLISSVQIALLIVILAALDNRPDRLAHAFPFLLAFPVLVWLFLVSSFSLSEMIRRELHRPFSATTCVSRIVRGIGLTLFFLLGPAALPAAALIAICTAVPIPRFATSDAILGCAAWTALMTIVLTIQTRDWIKSYQRYEDWESLELDEPVAP